MPKLDLPAKTAGSNTCAAGEFLELWAVGNEYIARILTLRHSGEIDAIGQLKRYVFDAVHGDIDAAIQQRLVDFLGEQTLSSDVRQWHIQNFVACRLDGNQLDLHVRPASLDLTSSPGGLP